MEAIFHVIFSQILGESLARCRVLCSPTTQIDCRVTHILPTTRRRHRRAVATDAQSSPITRGRRSRAVADASAVDDDYDDYDDDDDVRGVRNSAIARIVRRA